MHTVFYFLLLLVFRHKYNMWLFFWVTKIIYPPSPTFPILSYKHLFPNVFFFSQKPSYLIWVFLLFHSTQCCLIKRLRGNMWFWKNIDHDGISKDCWTKVCLKNILGVTSFLLYFSESRDLCTAGQIQVTTLIALYPRCGNISIAYFFDWISVLKLL